MNPFTMKSMPRTLLAAAALLLLPSCSEQSQEPKTEHAEAVAYKPGVPGGTTVDTTTLTATIASVYPSERTVVLNLPDNKRETVKCGPQVANFDQLRAGDQVKITAIQQLAVAMASESDQPDTGAAGETQVALAPKGGQPAAVMAKTRQVTATVTAIDVGHHTATLQFPDGQTHTINVRHDVDLTQRKVGEKVTLRTTDAIAVHVEKAQKP